ncbi:MAG: hypothetical protein DSY80_03415 [Desulfocapsa sp.]|nr:MAG: hypothetical protein DSY80_03415 [Desulfocapsa sp.]
MKNTVKHSIRFFLALCILLVASQTVYGTAAKVDILFMNHGPMRPTVAKIKTLLHGYGNTVQAGWYDVDQQSGQDFMRNNKINGHIPMLIRIDGQSEFTIDGRAVSFQGFPTGASPFKRVEGNWSPEDLKILLDQKTK